MIRILKKTNLYEVIEKLDKAEKKAFIKWLQMKNQQVNASSFQILDRLITKKKESLTREETFGKLFPDKKYNDGNFRRYLHNLLSEFKRFASSYQMQKDAIEEDKNWLKWLREKNLLKLYNKYFNKYLSTHSKEDRIPWKGGMMHYETIKENIDYISIAGEYPTNEIIALTTSIVETHLLSEILMWQLSLNNYKNIGLEVPSFDLGKYAIALTSDSDFQNPDVVELLLLAIEVSKPDCTQSTFTNYCKKLKELHQGVSNDLNYSLFMIRSNYLGFRHFKHGIEEALREYFESEKERYQLGYGMKYGITNYVSYRNMIGNALDLNELEWANSFNEEFKKYVPIEQRESAYLVNKGKILFHESKYEASLLIFNQIEIDIYPTYLATKQYQAQIYYKLKDTQAFELSTVSTLRNMNRKKADNFFYDIYVDFYKFLSAIYKLRDNFDLQKRDNLIETITNTERVINKNWLIEELNLLS